MLTSRDKHILIATFVFSIGFLVACALVAPRYMMHLVRRPLVVAVPAIEQPVVVVAPVIASAPAVATPIARRPHKVVHRERDMKQTTPSIGDCNGDPLCHIVD